MSGRSIHVFATDCLPFPGCARTAGGNRSIQVISALRQAGHRVTFSFDLGTYTARTWAEEINRHLNDEERWLCRHHSAPEIVLNRLQPEIAIYCNVNTFKTVRRFARDIIHIVDLNGPVHLEDLMMMHPSKGGIGIDGNRIEVQCWQLVEKLRQIDYVLTVSERQKYFWLAYCSLAGFNFSELNALICPFCLEGETAERNPADSLTIVHAGGFYPWQDPERFLRAAAEFLDEIPGAKLHVVGRPHPGLPNEAQTEAFLQELKTHRSVHHHGFLPMEKLAALLSTAWAALDVMEQTIERELAINGRTLQFLAAGIPVIYNNYSTLSADIRDHRAGWTIPIEDPARLKPVFAELVSGGLPLVRELSANARELSEGFGPIRAMEPLVELCKTARKRPSMTASRHRKSNAPAAPVGKVLAICPQAGVRSELRIDYPLGALHRQRLIDGFQATDAACEGLAKDNSFYEAIVIQRAVRESVYLALGNLGLPYLLDVDANLLALAHYRERDPEAGLVSGLRLASVLTSPNPRLVRLLEKYSGVSLANRAFITPNALPDGSATTATPARPSQIIWIQSDIAVLGNSRDTVVRAVEDFSTRYGLPVVLVGKNALGRSRFTNQVKMGEVDLSSKLQLLANAPTSIGVAPLETDADPETLDFIGGQSDLEIVLFGGYGHPGVFSASPPYMDSPFGDCGRITNNSYAEWMEALEYQYREGWKSAAAHARRIQEERNADRVARESWAPAIQVCALPRPVRGAEVYEVLKSFNVMNSNPASAVGYLVANPDVGREYVTADRGAWEHYLNHGRDESRSLSHDPDAHSRLLAKLDEESDRLFHRGESRFMDLQRRLAGGQNAVTISHLHDEVQRLQAEVNDLRSSYSWKITGPLRALTKPLIRRMARSK